MPGLQRGVAKWVAAAAEAVWPAAPAACDSQPALPARKARREKVGRHRGPPVSKGRADAGQLR